MSVDAARAILVGPQHPAADALAASLGAELARVAPGQLDALPDLGAAERLVWLHMAPALASDAAELDEAGLVVRSARAAQAAAAGAGVPLTFLALLPSHGLFGDGPRALACELARAAFDALMHAEIGAWSARGDRILGVVYPGLDGHVLDGQRSPERVQARIPCGALATVDQVADAVRYLGSRRATYVTGTLLHVDGGWNAYSWIYPARTI